MTITKWYEIHDTKMGSALRLDDTLKGILKVAKDFKNTGAKLLLNICTYNGNNVDTATFFKTVSIPLKTL